MDKIFIQNLSIFAYHGVYDFEQIKGQRFIISAVLETDTRNAGLTDDINDSTDYSAVCKFMSDFLTQNTFHLLESAAEQVCRNVLMEFPLIRNINLRISKPDAPIDLDFETVGVEINRGWHVAYIGLGSNIGNKQAFIDSAINSFQWDENIRLLTCSSLIDTKPYGGVEQDDFLNGVCKLETLYTPHELLKYLHRIEASAGRERLVHWGPRTLDLDILLYDNLIFADKDLVIPHKDMINRDFVLEPLVEIAPYLMHPVLNRSFASILEELKKNGSDCSN